MGDLWKVTPFLQFIHSLPSQCLLKWATSCFRNASGLTILAAKVITDRMSGRSKGYGFVTYETMEEAEKAREGMNAKFLDGWVIFVDPAKPREPRPPPQPESQQSESGFRTNKTVGWCG